MRAGPVGLTQVSTSRHHADLDPHAPALIDVQRRLHAMLGSRYRLLNPLGGTPAPRSTWRTYLAQDASLRRKVVLRLASGAQGSTAELYQRLSRARTAAPVSAHLISRVYDAVLEVDADRTDPPTASAAIVSEYFEGRTVAEALRRTDVDGTDLMAALAGRVAEAAEHGISFGTLRPDQVVLTADGPAITALPQGPTAQCGRTRLDAIATLLRDGAVDREPRMPRPRTWRAARHRAPAA